MARKNKSAVRRYHDRVARKYDASYEDEFWQWHDALTWDHIKPHIPANLADPLLDLGCGTGKWALKLAQSGYRVTCVDISGAMVEKARRKFEEAGLADRAAFVRADLCDMSELPAGAFAFAVALGDPIGCAQSPPQAMREIRRLLVPGGKLAATFDNRWAALDFYLERGDARETEQFIAGGKTHWLTNDAHEQFEIHTYSPGQVAKLLERSGFQLLDMIGKTVLPMRHHRHLLAESAARRQWSKIEKQLWRDPAAVGRAGHIQIIAQSA